MSQLPFPSATPSVKLASFAHCRSEETSTDNQADALTLEKRYPTGHTVHFPVTMPELATLPTPPSVHLSVASQCNGVLTAT